MTAEPFLWCELVGNLPALAAAKWGRRPALTFADRTWLYEEAAHEVEVIVRALHATGVRKGDRVAVWLTNSPEIQFLIFAICRLGAVVVPLNTRLKAMELSFALRHSGSVLLVAGKRSGAVDFEEVLNEAVGTSTASAGRPVFEHTPQLRLIVTLGDATLPNCPDWASFLASGHAEPVEAPALDPSDVAMMMFTSGTTGQPKGVLLSHAGLRLCYDRARIMKMTPDDVQLTYLPLFHIYAIGYSMFMSFMSGASQVLMDHFNGDEALRLIAKHRVTMFHGFEAHIADLLAALSRVDADIGSLRTATIAAGAESMVALVRRAQQELCPTLSSYGLSEVWGGVTISPPDASMSQRCEASGLPQSGVEIRIVDPESGTVQPTGAVGEIQIRSFSCMIGYHQNPEATASAFDAGGWFRTGDAGLMRDDGHLRWLARYKDMLKVGGENVAPAEIEELLGRIPGVQAVAVVGQRQERLQEVPIAFVVASGTSRPTEQSIRDYFRGKIASFKIPSRVIFVDELPMTSTGKVQKEALRKRLVDGIG